MKNFSGVCQAAGVDKPLRAFFIWITNIVTLLVLSFLVFSDIKIHVEYLNKLKYECCQNSKPEKSIVYVDTDKENCERYRQNDRENQQYNRTFQLVHTNFDLSV